MSHSEKYPMTLAIRELQKHNVPFTHHLFSYQEKGGTAHSSQELGVAEHAVIKTLIMENENKEPLVVLMHGDMQVSTKQLARFLNVKTIQPCKPEVADRHSGYQVGGTSPFGTKKTMPTYMEESILQLERIYINGGKRGYLVGMSPQDVQNILNPTLVHVGVVG